MLPPSTHSLEADARIRVMLVDDSAIIRGLMTRAIKADADIEVVASASDGQMALRVLDQHAIDVVVLDIEMPNMDGLAALPLLLKKNPKLKVIMASTLTQRSADVSLRALELGAVDYVAKPSSQKASDDVDNFFKDIRQKIKAVGASALRERKLAALGSGAIGKIAPVKPRVVADAASLPLAQVKALAVASSTGGPQALMTFFSAMKGRLNHIPIYITQHMPASFTTILAEHLTRDGGRVFVEPKDGEVAMPGKAYIAPGNYHMLTEQSGHGVVMRLNQDPPVNFCRPAADPMLFSLNKIYGKHLLVVVLTGMGADGLEGAKDAVSKGASVVAQDEATSVVWGMPGAVSEAGICRAVLPLKDIAPYVVRACGGI